MKRTIDLYLPHDPELTVEIDALIDAAIIGIAKKSKELRANAFLENHTANYFDRVFRLRTQLISALDDIRYDIRATSLKEKS